MRRWDLTPMLWPQTPPILADADIEADAYDSDADTGPVCTYWFYADADQTLKLKLTLDADAGPWRADVDADSDADDEAVDSSALAYSDADAEMLHPVMRFKWFWCKVILKPMRLLILTQMPADPDTLPIQHADVDADSDALLAILMQMISEADALADSHGTLEADPDALFRPLLIWCRGCKDDSMHKIQTHLSDSDRCWMLTLDAGRWSPICGHATWLRCRREADSLSWCKRSLIVIPDTHLLSMQSWLGLPNGCSDADSGTEIMILDEVSDADCVLILAEVDCDTQTVIRQLVWFCDLHYTSIVICKSTSDSDTDCTLRCYFWSYQTLIVI